MIILSLLSVLQHFVSLLHFEVLIFAQSERTIINSVIEITVGKWNLNLRSFWEVLKTTIHLLVDLVIVRQIYSAKDYPQWSIYLVFEEKIRDVRGIFVAEQLNIIIRHIWVSTSVVERLSSGDFIYLGVDSIYKMLIVLAENGKHDMNEHLFPSSDSLYELTENASNDAFEGCFLLDHSFQLGMASSLFPDCLAWPSFLEDWFTCPLHFLNRGLCYNRVHDLFTGLSCIFHIHKSSILIYSALGHTNRFLLFNRSLVELFG